jgi:hypothetical protein
LDDDDAEEILMRARGVTYDTGFSPGGHNSRTRFDPAQVRRELRVIAEDLHCDAVRITGEQPERLSLAARAAAEAGLEVWFSPFPVELGEDALRPYFAECAERAEEIRRTGAEVVLVTGCELSLFASGFLPGATCFERIDNVLKGDPALYGVFPDALQRLGALLTGVAGAARSTFGGRITYAAGTWEDVDWSAFDIVSVDAYLDANNRDTFAEDLRGRLRAGKPVAVTEFGCCTYRGAGDRGGLGWTIVDENSDPPRLNGDHVRDEFEQVRYLDESLKIFEEVGVDTAFWFTFAGFDAPRRDDPRYDLDLASYGLVAMGEDGQSWTPKAAFDAVATAFRS